MIESIAQGEAIRAVFGSEVDRPQFVSSILAFRKRVLVDVHGWNLSVNGVVERDEFDTADTVHCGVFAGPDLVACFRAIRCDRPYLGYSKFPQLAVARGYPKHAFAWEISRFAVMGNARRFAAALLNYSAMFHFARAQGAVSLVAFCDLSHERLLGRIGIVTERYGPPMEIDINRAGRPVEVIAGEIPMPRQSGVRFEKIVSLAQFMEIEDAFTVVRHPRVSA